MTAGSGGAAALYDPSRGRQVVGVGDMKVIAGSGELVMTFALGSCLGITVHDPVARVGAMLHAMLPSSRDASERMRNNPYLFVDTGVPEMFRRCYDLGLEKSRAHVTVAGGASIAVAPGAPDVFEIGRKNLELLDRLLGKNGLSAARRDCGGRHSRTMVFDVSTGEVRIKVGNDVVVL